MKTMVLILTFLFLVLQGYTQIPQSPNKINANGQKDGDWTILYNENWKETKNPDSVRYYRKITFLDGKPTGIVRDYYLSGKVQWEGKIKSLDPPVQDDGPVTWYFENGNINTKLYYLNGKPNGEYKEYFTNGNDSVNGFYKNGYRDNLFIYFYPSGKIWSKIIFHQDSLWDVLFTNDSLGNPLIIGNLKNGNGYIISYFFNGIKSFEGEYKKGIKNGSFIYYFQNGKKSQEGEYKNEIKVGFWKEYDTTGGWGEGNYTNGKPDGIWIFWYSNGNKKGEHSYVNGIKEGVWIDWFEDGKKSSQGRYENDLKEGPWNEFFPNGNHFEELYTGGVPYCGSYSVWTYWDSNGKKLGESEDTRTWVLYDEKGKITSKGIIKNYKQFGTWTFYFENGKISGEGDYTNGIEEGLWTEWNEKGQKFIGNYKNGKKEWDWTWFKSDGSYGGELYYINGILQK